MFRRGFLKTASILVGGVMLPVYSEPLLQALPHHDWVQDKGDYYIVNVPERKVFKGESLDKPTIFLCGAGSSVLNTSVNGFVNMRGSTNVTVSGFNVDIRNFRSTTNRPAIILQSFISSIIENVSAQDGHSARHIAPIVNICREV